MTALIVDMLEAALGGDQERALRLAEEAGVSRFELSMLRRSPRSTAQYDEGFNDGQEHGWHFGVDEGARGEREGIVEELRKAGFLRAANLVSPKKRTKKAS